MAGLLDFLLGGAAGSPPPHTWGYDANGNLVPSPASPNAPPQALQAPPSGLQALTNPPAPLAPINAPAPSQGAPSPLQPPAVSAAGQAPIVVPGQSATPDTWQPKNNGILGQIADFIIGTHTGRGVDEKNMEGAIEHITSDPMEAVKRMAKFNPEAAVKLLNIVQDNQRQTDNLGRQNKLLDMAQDKYLDGMVGNMMNSAHDDASYAAIRDHAINYAQRYGKDYSDLIPEQYDPLNAEAFANGVMPVAKQRALQEQTRNHNLQHSDRQATVGEQHYFHSGELGIGEQNVGLRGQSNAIAQENADAHVKSVNNQASRHGFAASGTLPNGDPYAITDDGQSLIRRNGGKAYQYVRGTHKNGKTGWILIGPVKGSTVNVNSTGDNSSD